MKEFMEDFHASAVPFLAAAYQGVLSEEPAQTFCCFGNEKQFAVLRPPAGKLKTNKQKTVSRCLRSGVGTHSKVDKVPFHTAVWSPSNLYMGAVSLLGCLRPFPAFLSI